MLQSIATKLLNDVHIIKMKSTLKQVLNFCCCLQKEDNYYCTFHFPYALKTIVLHPLQFIQNYHIPHRAIESAWYCLYCLSMWNRCLRHRKVLGGGMRQAGVLAAAGIYALDHIAPKLHQDHTNAQIVAQGWQKHWFILTVIFVSLYWFT